MTPAAQQRQEAERHFLEGLRSRFEDEGFSFITSPNPPELPGFLGQYRPTAVARKGAQNVAIELKSGRTPLAEQSLRRVRQLFEGRPDWQLRVFFVGGGPQDAVEISASEPEKIHERVGDIRRLLGEQQRQAAFIMAWSLLEATLRSRLREQHDGRAYAPGTLVQTLAMDGTITPEVEREMRALIGLRNRVVHGDLEAEPTDAQVDFVLSVISAALSTTVASD